ncbi:serine/threonine protein phosphatase 5, Metallo-dependent phosphatase-like protein [Artemisia annua]|uniref:Serine/threonine protein phosphatase 5, Metallo-dependent phosphatase-like protein n=1 Tax=Artemisia annua TaxID=35608 RepID=A0A2U1NX25_ARTAN|nr:serine/threonine protein phosphatase 5, Metallo-dependent phosphatase-like protein [Artemisia annua]
MEDQKICLDVKAFHITVDGLCRQAKVKEATDAIDIMVDSCKYLDIVIFNSLSDGYSLLGSDTNSVSGNNDRAGDVSVQMRFFTALLCNDTKKVNLWRNKQRKDSEMIYAAYKLPQW